MSSPAWARTPGVLIQHLHTCPVCCSRPGARLVDMVVSPHALVESGGALRLNGHYYISRQIIPALERVLSLVRGP